MKFESPLIKATLIKRYKRFLADCVLDNSEAVTIHCPNSGSMLGFLEEGTTIYLTKILEPKKLNYRWELSNINGNLVGVNTQNANKIVYEALKNQAIEEVNSYTEVKPEAKYSDNCRFDFLLNNKNTKCFIEVKNVQLSRKKGLAEFPDSVTERGTKHLEHLIKAVEQGYKSYIFFLSQRSDIDKIAVAKDIDTTYYNTLKKALLSGVEILCYNCNVSLNGIILNKKGEMVL